MTSVAQRLRQKLLDLAIHGKLVPQNPQDEPAGELLARIRKARLQLLAAKGIKKEGQIIPVGEDEVPFELPKEWTWCRFRELGILTGGHTPSMANPKFWNGDVLWVTSKDMKRKYIEDTGAKITALGADELTMLEPGAVLMCTRSGILRRTFPVAIAAKELTINQDQRALTLALPEMAEYVYSALCALEPLILAEYRKTGTTVESIIWEKFIDMPFPLPPLTEQKRIVEKLNAMLKEATRVAEGTERLAQLRKKARAKILDLAIRGKLVKQEKSDEPATELLARIRALREGRASARPKGAGRSGGRPGDRTRGSASLPEEPFELPQGWAWCRFEDVAYSIASKPYQVLESTVNSTGMYPVVSQGQKEIDGYSDDSGKVFRDVPVVIFGDHTRNVKFRDRPFIVGADGTKLFKPLVDAEWMYYWTLYSAEFQIEARGYQRHWSKLVTLPIPLPPLAEQRRIVTKVKEMLAACDALGGHV